MVYCDKHESLCIDVDLIKKMSVSNTDTLKDIKENHLAHLQDSYKGLAKDMGMVKWFTVGGVTIIAILVALFGAIILLKGG